MHKVTLPFNLTSINDRTNYINSTAPTPERKD
jgi:hypothetical protein